MYNEYKSIAIRDGLGDVEKMNEMSKEGWVFLQRHNDTYYFGRMIVGDMQPQCTTTGKKHAGKNKR